MGDKVTQVTITELVQGPNNLSGGPWSGSTLVYVILPIHTDSMYHTRDYNVQYIRCWSE